MKLNALSESEGARNRRKRVGRGIGSGLGTTGGRGMKGQKSRSGVAINGYEGGQMPLYMRLPKRGFKKPGRKRFQELTLSKLQAAVDKGRIKEGAVAEKDLLEAGVVRRLWDGVSLIGGGNLQAKLQIEVTRATKSAVAGVEKAGGKVTLKGAPASA